MRVRLLGSGGYSGHEGVLFPVEVEAISVNANRIVEVSHTELARVGWKSTPANRNPAARIGAKGWSFGPEEYETVESEL